MYFFAGMAKQPGCKFQSGNGSGIAQSLVAMIYTPSVCTVILNSVSTIAQGQILGGTVTFTNTISFQYKPVTVPGTGVGGFKEDVSYIREVSG